jgi:hypothetical protein
VIGETWVVSLPDVKDVMASDCVLPTATVFHSRRRATQFTSRRPANFGTSPWASCGPPLLAESWVQSLLISEWGPLRLSFRL